MIQFGYPHLLYLLLLVPILAALFVWAQYARRRKLQRFGRLSTLASLMPDASKYMGWTKTVLALLALTFIVLAMARPYVPKDEAAEVEEKTARGIEVMICLDVSNSMLASSTDDPNGISRLQRAKFILEKLIDKMNDDKVGLIVFAGDAYTQLPITSDYISAKMFLGDISTNMVPTQGTAIGAALEMAINSFTPNADFQKAIVLITDGENFEDDATEVAKRAAQAGIQVDVIGLGSGKGAPIPLGRGQYMNDHNGNQVITALNETEARAIAKEGDGIYLNGSSASVVNDLDEELNKLAKSEYTRIAGVSATNELFPLAAWLALILLLIDGMLPYSKISWLRDINFFSQRGKNNSKSGSAAGKVGLILILLSCSVPALHAADSDTPEQFTTKHERNYIREGNKLYKEKRYAEAEVMYSKALEEVPTSEVAQFNLAAALLRQGGTPSAENNDNPMNRAVGILNALTRSAQDATIAELAFYNLGNVAFNNEQYDQSIAHYKNALRRNPDNDQARENLRLAQLKKQEQQDQQQDQDQDQQQQEQEQNQDQQQQDQQNQDQDQQNQDQQNQDQDQQQQQQDKDKQQQQQQQQGISDANAEKILKAMENEEAATRRRVEAERQKAEQAQRRRILNPW